MILTQTQPVPSIIKTKKALIIVHNHPLVAPGGSEILAYDLFESIKTHTHYDAFFLAASNGQYRQSRLSTPFQTVNNAADEILFWGGEFNHFYQSQNNHQPVYSHFKNFLQELQPDVVHFHHSINIGLEVLSVVRQTLPNVKIVYTIHEFLLICNRDGQMIYRHNNDLCEYASPSRCNRCFPEISPQKFRMREEFIKAHLKLVDIFVSPSHFLANRFIDWGIAKEKIIVIENGRKIVPSAPPRNNQQSGKRNVFGFFGQINPYKGVIFALEAVAYLVKNEFTDFRLELFGSIDTQTQEFQHNFFKLVDRYKNNVTYHGGYRNDEMPDLIKQVDWAIVPSTWWENSPLVIQEVFMHRRPIICSNIGGMAEKVEDNVTGLHFKVKNAVSLAETIEKASLQPDLWDRLRQNIQPRLSIKECAQKHVSLYDL